MKIIKMTASFGKLRNAVLELSPGLNIIQAPNEGGKSTWCAFIRAMLYGIPTRERDTKTTIAEKNRYQPWAGSAMEGVMELEWRGSELTLRRGPKGSTPFGEFSAVYTATGAAVPGLTGENCGEKLLGISREVFERSAFISQSGAAIGESAELERRIAALVSSGEEDVSYTEVDSRLREWLRRRRHNKSGQIPRLENELEVLDDTLRRQERAEGQAAAASHEIEELSARKEVLQSSLNAWRSRENQERLHRYEAAQAELAAARQAVETLEAEAAAVPEKDELRAAQGDLAYLNTLESNRKLAESQLPGAKATAEAAEEAARDTLFPAMTPEQAEAQAAQDAEEVLRKPKKAPLWAGILGGVLGAVAGGLIVAGVVLEKQMLFFAAAVLVALVGLSGVILGIGSLQRKKKQAAKAVAVLERYGAKTPEEITARAAAYREKWEQAQEAKEKAAAVEQAAADLAGQRSELLEALLDMVHTFEPSVTDAFGISAAISKALNVTERLSNARVRLEGAQRLAESLPRPAECPEGQAAHDSELSAEFDPEGTAAMLAAADSELGRLRSTLAMAQGELNTLGDPALFQARRETLQEELARRQEEYDALTLALEGLSEANGELQARFSPALNAEAGAILTALTGGKYRKVTLNREFEAAATESESPLPRRTILLSQGTAEQVYLAARLAVCRLALPEEEPVPVILDDALDSFDDERMALALDCLRTLGRERQVLLFTCHSREAARAALSGGAAVQSLQS